MIDARLGQHDPEELAAGEAVAGMILNGLGFAKRPLSLTPPFFANKPLDRLWRPGVRADLCNRFQLGRSLDEVHPYGCDLLLSDIACAVGAHEGIAQRCNHLDTTSCARTGDDISNRAEHALALTHGYAKDHRPDLKQAI